MEQMMISFGRKVMEWSRYPLGERSWNGADDDILWEKGHGMEQMMISSGRKVMGKKLFF